MENELSLLREHLTAAHNAVFFGGAGVSTESGIPDFRSAHGIYAGAQGHSYEEMLSLRYFQNHTDTFWDFYKNVMLYPAAKPNAAHYALAALEKRGVLSAVLTQNIDGLHQAAGSRHVVELHGTVHSNTCLRCGARYDLSYVLAAQGTPHCACGGVLRPDIILYGEPLCEPVLQEAVSAVERCDLLIVGGTSLVVHPAAGLITYRRRGVPLILINRDETPYDDRAQLILRGNIATVLAAIVDEGETA